MSQNHIEIQRKQDIVAILDFLYSNRSLDTA